MWLLARPYSVSTTTAFAVGSGYRGDILVTTHTDVPARPPEGDDDRRLAKRAGPGESVMMVGVDQSSVEVEDRRETFGPYATKASRAAARRCSSSSARCR